MRSFQSIIKAAMHQFQVPVFQPVFILMALGFIVFFPSCKEKFQPQEVRTQKPDIFPDYTGVTIPSTMAPLNFKGNGEYSVIDAVIEGKNKQVIHIQGKKDIRIPEKKWAQLLSACMGDSLQITVSFKQDGKWVRFAPFSVHVSKTPIDYGLTYRLIAPGYEVYSKMGIYQRNLSNYEQSPIIENTLLPGSCVNCHSFRQSNPGDMSFHIRGKQGGTVLMTQGKVKLLNTKTEKTLSNFTYPYWHPSGNYIAYSVNIINQGFHAAMDKRVEVVDGASDVVVYDIRNNQAISSSLLMQDSRFETFPSFSPDGRTLYFCSAAAQKMPDEYNLVKYNLCSISFNPETGTFGDRIDTLFNATALNKSVTFPRPSPDGRFVMFSLIDYGNFSIWHKESDLYLFNVQTGESKRLDKVNSDDTESYHSWATNSRWFVFSSRRLDGLYTRPFMAYVDENGTVGKPFLLPQEDPDFYMELMQSYNIPEFITGRVKINANEVENLVRKDEIKQVENLKIPGK